MEFLPPQLKERTRALGAARSGDFVVYWMRAAMRAGENPALDVALLAGKELGKPVFVYQALSERYRYASDRHHTFILEGARDVSRALAERGVGYAFHLERPGHRGAHLRTLATAAALVVTEDFPVAPFAAVDGYSGWDAEVAKLAPLWRVDTACVVPFRAVREKPTRAVAYRAERSPRWDEALAVRWEPVEAGTPRFLPELTFEPLSLNDDDEASVEAWIAQCEIDHTVAPAQQSRGGTLAGEQRWARFQAEGLAAYGTHREDPLEGRTSRLSPYLHYGMVSPFKVAREARAHGSEGAARFLEELLVWRELAWSFCALEPRHRTTAALPDWARATLKLHEGDARLEHAYDTLCRAQTGDALWDAAQRALVARGEVAPPVRVAWGKALLGWSRDAEAAMAVAIDLNDRFALDGRDPASYLGILYCLGGFDRAASPELPVLGKVRPRAAPRFDVAEYARRTHQPARGQPLTVAVVGGGVAGAACARALVDAGQEATVFEAAAEGGGRCSDQGAPWFEASDARWLSWVRAWTKEGSVAPWRNGYVGAPAMNGVVKRMLHGLDVRYATRVSSVERHGGLWRLVAASGAGLGEYDAVVVTTPAPQAEGLLKWSAPDLATRLAEAVMAPQWVATVTLTEALGLEEWLDVNVGSLVRMVRESAKPSRPQVERWTFFAAYDWSRKHLDDSPQTAAAALLDAFWAATGARPQSPVALAAHCWRHARVEKPVGVPCLFDASLRVAAAGDGCLGDGVEAAFLSGCAAAGRLNALRGVGSEAEPVTVRGAQLPLF